MSWIIHSPEKVVEAGGRLDRDEVLYGLTVGDLEDAYESLREDLLSDDPDTEPQLPPWDDLREAQRDAIVKAAGLALALQVENWPENLSYIVPKALHGEGDCPGCGQPILEGYQFVPPDRRYHPECWAKVREDRCPHAMFYSGAGACPQCGQ